MRHSLSHMKKNLLVLIAIAFVVAGIYSACKLDPPVLPGDKGYVQQYPPTSGAIGSTGSTGATGSTGSTGTTGSTGSTGATGSTGSTGSTGTTGATGSTGSLGTSAISGIWIVQSTTAIQTFAGQTSSTPFDDFFSSVTINDIAKTGDFKDPIQGGDQPFSYTTSGSGSSETITFTPDPFERPDGNAIRITSVTSTSMTWEADSPDNGGGYTFEYKVVMKKQ